MILSFFVSLVTVIVGLLIYGVGRDLYNGNFSVWLRDLLSVIGLIFLLAYILHYGFNFR